MCFTYNCNLLLTKILLMALTERSAFGDVSNLENIPPSNDKKTKKISTPVKENVAQVTREVILNPITFDLYVSHFILN